MSTTASLLFCVSLTSWTIAAASPDAAPVHGAAQRVAADAGPSVASVEKKKRQRKKRPRGRQQRAVESTRGAADRSLGEVQAPEVDHPGDEQASARRWLSEPGASGPQGASRGAGDRDGERHDEEAAARGPVHWEGEIDRPILAGEPTGDPGAAEVRAQAETSNPGALVLGHRLGPLSSEGLLWLPMLGAAPRDGFALKSSFSHHGALGGDAWLMLFTASGEYTFFDAVTVGASVPFLAAYQVQGPVGSSFNADFGNVQLHARWAVWRSPEHHAVLTPGLRTRLPTNTFLRANGGPTSARLVNGFTTLEPFVAAQAGLEWLTFTAQAGGVLALPFDADPIAFASLQASLAVAPVPALPDLALVTEIEAALELTERAAPRVSTNDRLIPIAASAGARYQIAGLYAELALRIGIVDHDLYYGNVNVGLTVGYALGTEAAD